MKRRYYLFPILLLTAVLFFPTGCNSTADMEAASVREEHDHEHEAEREMLTLPELQTAVADGRQLQVAVTTSIIGDVVQQVGGDAIALTTLMKPGQDPHSYEPAAQELTAVARADIIFVNGWDLEEALLGSLHAIGGDQVPFVAVSAGIEPLGFNGNEDVADPHVWFDVQNVVQWTNNIEQVLTQLDPKNTAVYQANAQAYREQLTALDANIKAQLGDIPPERRYLATNHGALNYFAHAYDFQIVGTIIPSMSALAEPSAGDMADLIAKMEEKNLCAIFAETTVSDTLAQTLSAELDHCHGARVYQLFTGAIGLPGTPADSYIGMMQANINAIAEGAQLK